MTWTSAAPSQPGTGKWIVAPLMLCAKWETWGPLLNGRLDEMTSDPRTLDILSSLVAYTQPKIIVEVGTYRGIGTATLAETLYDLPDSHIWSCDPVDFQVGEALAQAGLTDRVTLVHGMFEDVLPLLPSPMDFCYIDASHPGEAGMRLRYTRLALEHTVPGGLIAVDDAGADWKGSKTLRRMADLYLPHGRGLAVLVK